MLKDVQLILASTSERRQAMLRAHGHRFRVVPPQVPEPDQPADCAHPAHVAESFSYFKAQSVASAVDGVILAADTVVALGRRLFGKPCDQDHARDILASLRGTTHHVITGMTLLDARAGRRLIRHDTTAVTMRRLSDQLIDAYLITGAWVGKAGAFGIQDSDDPFVERIDGSYTNVVGLPMELLTTMLEDFADQGSPR